MTDDEHVAKMNAGIAAWNEWFKPIEEKWGPRPFPDIRPVDWALRCVLAMVRDFESRYPQLTPFNEATLKPRASGSIFDVRAMQLYDWHQMRMKTFISLLAHGGTMPDA